MTLARCWRPSVLRAIHCQSWWTTLWRRPTLLSAVVSTALKSAAYAVVYVVSFLLLLLLLRLVLTPLHLFTKLPVVHGVNALLGGVLGLVKAALLLFLAVWVLQKLQLLVTPELVSKTVLLKFFAQNSPIDLIAKL